MFGGNRLFHFAARGFLIAAILVVNGASLSADPAEQPSINKNQNGQTTQYQGTAQPLFAPNENQERPARPQAADDKADYYAKSDLEAQESMAAEAKRLGELTESQIFIARVDSVLLFFTLAAAGFAAYAAWSAAKSGKEIVDVTRDSAERQLRAYVHIEKIRLEFIKTAQEWVVVANIKNYGQTPAKNCWVRMNVLYGGDYSTVKFVPCRTIVSKHVASIPPGDHTSTAVSVRQGKRWEKFKAGKLEIYAHGRFEYQDAWGQRRATWFRMHKAWKPVMEFALCPYGNRHT